MDIRTVELYLERTFSKGRKEMSGSGAVRTKVRIVDDVIFVKMQLEYTGMEKLLFKFISGNEQEECYYDSVREEAKTKAEKTLHEICPLLDIKAIHFKVDMGNGYSFVTIVLDDDLEKLIKDGKIMKPDKMLSDSQFVCSC
jgi:uncharacterized protein YbcI